VSTACPAGAPTLKRFAVHRSPFTVGESNLLASFSLRETEDAERNALQMRKRLQFAVNRAP